MRSARRDGFTLMELLVVVAILSLLAALLFPVLAQVRDKARQATCVCNLKQLAAGMQLYADDYEDLFPPVLAGDRSDPGLFPATWMGRLQPYVRSDAVFIDPASNHHSLDWRANDDLLRNYSFPPRWSVTGGDLNVVTAQPYGAALWDGIGGFSGQPVGRYAQPAPSRCRAEVVRPGEIILICDQKWFDWGFRTGNFYYPDPRHVRRPDLQMPDGSTVPQGLVEAAFVDGHVQALRHEQFWEILPQYSQQAAGRDVFRHFWPDE